jgi:hypothetical protein
MYIRALSFGQQFDPPMQIGDSWDVCVPTSGVMVQEGETLPEFPPADQTPTPQPTNETAPDESIPF